MSTHQSINFTDTLRHHPGPFGFGDNVLIAIAVPNAMGRFIWVLNEANDYPLANFMRPILMKLMGSHYILSLSASAPFSFKLPGYCHTFIFRSRPC